jgi:DNA-binding winged helix-turn-helix (wHTH) protein/tetratricopeptide (TPR) repeat protein
MKPGRPNAYRFGAFTLECSSYRLLKKTTVLQVSPKVIDLLLYLVARPSVLVSKEDLFKALWPDVAVTDNALTQAVSELRQAIGDDPSNPKFVQTVARRGYRFIAPVEIVDAMPGVTDGMPAESPSTLPAVGVLDFVNLSGDASLAWLSSGIAETVSNDLRSAAQLRVIDRTRIAEASRGGHRDPPALGRELGVDLAVVGSFQRAGERLRITARVVDTPTGEAVADAKADGALAEVFDLQDRIVTQLSEALTPRGGSTARRPYRETSSLEAYQAFTEARVRLETLDGGEVAGAIDGFTRAIELDPRYAAAYVGLANARFWQYEMSRARNAPDAALLATAIDHVRRAIELERDLAEAQATLAFLLVSAGRVPDALVAARRAVALEPGYWGHHFRVAHAAWGDERLKALGRVFELYPDFPFAHFEAAMVHIARGALERAESLLREGTIVQDRQAHLRQRFPARGLHWLLGLVRLARGDAREAAEEFDKERAGGTTQLYASEFVMNACDGAGFVRLAEGDGAGAVPFFQEALALFPEHARSLVGLGCAHEMCGQAVGAADAFRRATTALDSLRRGRRPSEAQLAQAFLHTGRGELDAAMTCLRSLVERPDVPFTGWTLPIEPLLAPLRRDADFVRLLEALAARAR